MPRCRAVPLDELAKLVDDRDGVQVALALRLSPRKQAMPAEHDAIAPRRLLDDLPQHHAKLETRPLPRQPRQLVAELLVELLHLDLAVRRGSQRDAPVRMQMVHMRKGQKPMQRGIDRSRNRVVVERAHRVQVDHLVFKFDALVRLLKREQPLEIKRRKPCALDAPEIPAASLHPQHLHRLARDRVRLHQLRARIAPAEVCNPQVRPKQVRPVPQQLRLIQLCGYRVIPTILKKLQTTLA